MRYKIILTALLFLLGISPVYAGQLVGVEVDSTNAFQFKLLMDGTPKQEEANQITEYFLTGITVPEKDLWVNLSPFEKEKVIPDTIKDIGIGQAFLRQDYQLKKVSSELVKNLKDIIGTSYAKIWIEPGNIEVNEYGNRAIISKAELKVVAEVGDLTPILPALTEMVNKDKRFAEVRQVYRALILGTWFKNALRESVYSQFAGQNKTEGMTNDVPVKEMIYQKYLKTFQDKAYNYITRINGKLYKKLGGGVMFEAIPNLGKVFTSANMPDNLIPINVNVSFVGKDGILSSSKMGNIGRAIKLATAVSSVVILSSCVDLLMSPEGFQNPFSPIEDPYHPSAPTISAYDTLVVPVLIDKISHSVNYNVAWNQHKDEMKMVQTLVKKLADSTFTPAEVEGVIVEFRQLFTRIPGTADWEISYPFTMKNTNFVHYPYGVPKFEIKAGNRVVKNEGLTNLGQPTGYVELTEPEYGYGDSSKVCPADSILTQYGNWRWPNTDLSEGIYKVKEFLVRSRVWTFSPELTPNPVDSLLREAYIAFVEKYDLADDARYIITANFPEDIALRAARVLVSDPASQPWYAVEASHSLYGSVKEILSSPMKPVGGIRLCDIKVSPTNTFKLNVIIEGLKAVKYDVTIGRAK